MHPKLVANSGVFFHSIIYCFQSWEGKHTLAVADLSATATVSNETAFFSGPRLNRPFLATFTTTPVDSKHGKMPKLPTSFYLDIVTTSVLTSNSNKNSRPKRFQHALNYISRFCSAKLRHLQEREASRGSSPTLWDWILWFLKNSLLSIFCFQPFFFQYIMTLDLAWTSICLPWKAWLVSQALTWWSTEPKSSRRVFFSQAQLLMSDPQETGNGFTEKVVVSNIFYFHPYLGNWFNLTDIFQMGWNHQIVQFFSFFIWIDLLQGLWWSTSIGLWLGSSVGKVMKRANLNCQREMYKISRVNLLSFFVAIWKERTSSWCGRIWNLLSGIWKWRV